MQSVYDGAGQRVATVAGGVITNVYVYDMAGDLVAEYGGGVSTNGTQYVMGDQQGSTRLTMFGSPVNGQLVVGRQDYLPFGEELPGSVGVRAGVAGYGQTPGPRQKYAGMEVDDATGMSHTPWREFDSLSARWTAPDPYGGSMELASPQSFNRYAYVNNDPVNKVDPAGLALQDIGVAQVNSAGEVSRLNFLSVHNFRYSVNQNYRDQYDARAAQEQQQSRQERTNAAFVGAMGRRARAKFSYNFFRVDGRSGAGTVQPRNTIQPFDVPGITTALEGLLRGNLVCYSFVYDILGRVHRANPDNPLVAGGDILMIFKMITQSPGGLVRAGGPGSIEGANFALGSFAEGNARIQLGNRSTGGFETDEEYLQAYNESDAMKGLHELMHHAGRNVYTDAMLAAAVHAKTGAPLPLTTGNRYADRYAYSNYWDRALRQACK